MMDRLVAAIDVSDLVISDPDRTGRVQLSQRRTRLGFSLLICLFVVVVSFLYGLSVGINKNSQQAFASRFAWENVFSKSRSRIELPAGVTAVSLGEEIEINGKPGEVVSFRTDRPAKEIVEEQATKWKARGDRVVAYATSHRGFAIGYSLERGERFSISTWFVPEPLRVGVLAGSPVQGMISIVDMGKTLAAEERGELAGIPLMPGGQSGAVFSAKEGNSRSYSGVYTNPAGVSESMVFYTNELSKSGWRIDEQKDAKSGRWRENDIGSLRFVKDKNELTMLFSLVEKEGKNSNGPERTVVSINLSPLKFSPY